MLTPRKNQGIIRQPRIVGNLAYIPLTNGKETVVDAADVPLVEGRNWHTDVGKNRCYARISLPVNGKNKNVRMHQILIPAPPGMVIDHINGDGLDNRRVNLRVVDLSKNTRNTLRRRSGHVPNVRLDTRRGTFDGFVYLGTFARKEDAEAAVLAAERTLGKPSYE